MVNKANCLQLSLALQLVVITGTFDTHHSTALLVQQHGNIILAGYDQRVGLAEPGLAQEPAGAVLGLVLQAKVVGLSSLQRPVHEDTVGQARHGATNLGS